MKRFLYLAAGIITACSQPEGKPIGHSSEVPHVSVCGGVGTDGEKNNIFEVTPSAQEMPVTVTANVPVISGLGEILQGSISSFVSADNGTTGCKGEAFSFRSAGNPGYTVDNEFVLEQSAWDNVWYEYAGYGPIETYVNFRIRGEAGTRYIDISRPGVYSTGEVYYIKGRLAYISPITYGTEPFISQKSYESFFRDWNYAPQTSYEAEYATLYIETESGPATVVVYGKRRDRDLDRLMEYAGIGDMIEVPAVFKTADDILSGTFGKVLSCRVLKL